MSVHWKHYIGLKGGYAIARALRTNTTLTDLDLNTNMLDNSVGIAIAEALQSNEALQDVKLSNNFFRQDGGLAFVTLLQRSRVSAGTVATSEASAGAVGVARLGCVSRRQLDLRRNHLGSYATKLLKAEGKTAGTIWHLRL